MVHVAPCADYSSENCVKALETALEGMLSWVKPGMKIAIKANLVTLLRPEAAATTHPALISALVDMLTKMGAECVIGDSPGGLFTNAYLESVYALTGMRGVKNASLNFNTEIKHAVYNDAISAKEFDYTAYLDSCDAIINFCKLKTHSMMGMSAAVKNMFGAVPGIIKSEMHYTYPEPSAFAGMLIDLNDYFRPRLNIVDAVMGMEGNGPTMGKKRKIGCVIAGNDPHEVDDCCAKIINVPYDDIPTLRLAREKGLYDTDYKIIGEITPVDDFEKAVTRDIQFMDGSFIGRFLSFALRSKPDAERKSCTGCGKCAKVCPAKAIVIKNKHPKIDRKACIRCYCCSEFCPKGAMKATRPKIAKLLLKK